MDALPAPEWLGVQWSWWVLWALIGLGLLAALAHTLGGSEGADAKAGDPGEVGPDARTRTTSRA